MEYEVYKIKGGKVYLTTESETQAGLYAIELEKKYSVPFSVRIKQNYKVKEEQIKVYMPSFYSKFCPSCHNGTMTRDFISNVYLTYPPQYKYHCSICGYEMISF